MKKVLFLLAVNIVLCTIIKAQPVTGLMAYWRMNGNFLDSTSNAINGTSFGSPPDTLNNLNQPVKAKRFNNPTSTGVQYVTTPVNALINFSGTQNFTISFAFCMTGPSWFHNGGFIDNNLNYGGYGVYIWNGGPGGTVVLQFNYKNGSVGSSTLPLGVWKYVCCVRNNGTLQVYIDGALNNSGTEGATAPVYSFNPRIGSMFFNAQSPPQYNPLHGSLDEMRIYNRALSQAEITNLYNVWLNPPVPVKLSSFTAVKSTNGVLLNWQTQTEQNASHFSIERSTDGTNFAEAGRVQAKGNSSNVTNYSYTDVWRGASVLYYRLKMVDADGKFTYSKVVIININKSGHEMVLFPNPVVNTLQLQVQADKNEEAVAEIYDINGSRVMTEKMVLAPGINNTAFDLAFLPCGNYTIKILSPENEWVKQFVKH